MYDFDVLVIGSGPGGQKAAIAAAKLERRVAIIERQDMIGGVAKQTLRVFNGSFKTIARTATRLEQATELAPRRVAEPSATVRRARKRSARRQAA